MQIYGESQFWFYPGTQLGLSSCAWAFVQVGDVVWGKWGVELKSSKKQYSETADSNIEKTGIKVKS